MTSLGKYELHEQLGKGGFGTVYRAVDTELDRVVALKILHPQLTTDTGFLERFRREARVTAGLENPHIVRIYDMGEAEGRVFIAMQYLPGGSLKQKLEQERALPFDEALEIMKQVCRGLQAAHKKGLVHRDVKPANILFDGEGQAVIGDFGLARAVQLSGSTESSSAAGGAGTPAYRAPELWRGKPPASPATDVYSLGCVLYEMLTGKVLFDGATPDEIITQHLVERPDIPESLPGGISAGIRPVLVKSLAKDPLERYLTVAEFEKELETSAKEPMVGVNEVATMPKEKRQTPHVLKEPEDPANKKKSSPFQEKVEIEPEKEGTTVIIQEPTKKPEPFFPTEPELTGIPVESRKRNLKNRWIGVVVIGIAILIIFLSNPAMLSQIRKYLPAYWLKQEAPASTCHIAFSSDRDGNFEIYLMDMDGGSPVRLTDNSVYDFEPVWSPDGSRIAFTSTRDGNQEIYTMNGDGSDQVRLTENNSDDWEPAWSPDGKRIAFDSYRDGNDDIYVMNTDGGNPLRLTDNSAGDFNPAWSPDGSRIAFVTSRDGNEEIYSINAEGGDPQRLTFTTYQDWFPAWSPDGSRIAFVSDRDGNHEIYTMNANGSDPVRLTFGAYTDWSPTWSLDGNHIAFESDRDGKNEIYIMNADGSDPVRVTFNAHDDRAPAWLPECK
ncbi:MAG: protein kinase [Anaerolineaceae bacterium]